MKLLITIFLSWILIGCTVNTPNLPKSDSIIKLELKDDKITAESMQYSYKFYQKDLKDEQKRYQDFYAKYQKDILGIYVNFNVKNSLVDAQYHILVNIKNMSSEQIEMLKNQFNAKKSHQLDALDVLFKAQGFYTTLSSSKPLDESTRLEKPITVSINDQSYQLSPVGEVMLIPLFPFVMMYGCATSRCV